MGFMRTLSRKLFIFQLIALFSFGATDAVADKHPLNVEDFIEIGNTYVIEQNFSVNRNLSSKGQVLFLTPGDAYRNMQASDEFVKYLLSQIYSRVLPIKLFQYHLFDIS